MRHERSGLTESERYTWLAEIDSELHLNKPGSASSARERRNKGWALKSAKRTNKMEEKVKAFLVQKFNQGVAGRQKADPIHVAREIKSIRDSSGKLQFKPDEWRTAQQISNFFARMSVGGDRGITISRLPYVFVPLFPLLPPFIAFLPLSYKSRCLIPYSDSNRECFGLVQNKKIVL